MWKVRAWFSTAEIPGRELSPPTSSQLHQATVGWVFWVWWVASPVQSAAQASFQTFMTPFSTLLGPSWLRNWGEALCHVHPRPDACCCEEAEPTSCSYTGAIAAMAEVVVGKHCQAWNTPLSAWLAQLPEMGVPTNHPSSLAFSSSWQDTQQAYCSRSQKREFLSFCCTCGITSLFHLYLNSCFHTHL